MFFLVLVLSLSLSSLSLPFLCLFSSLSLLCFLTFSFSSPETDLWSWGECGTYYEHGHPPPLNIFVPFKVKQLEKYHVKRVWAGMYNCVVLVVEKNENQIQ